MIGVEGEDARVDNRMLKDDRAKERDGRSLFNRDTTDRIDSFNPYGYGTKPIGQQ